MTEQHDPTLADIHRSLTNLHRSVDEVLRPIKTNSLERQVWNDRDLVAAERESEIETTPMVSRERYIEALRNEVGTHSLYLDASAELSKTQKQLAELRQFRRDVAIALGFGSREDIIDLAGLLAELRAQTRHGSNDE